MSGEGTEKTFGFETLSFVPVIIHVNREDRFFGQGIGLQVLQDCSSRATPVGRTQNRQQSRFLFYVKGNLLRV